MPNVYGKVIGAGFDFIRKFEVKTVSQISNMEEINRLDEGEKHAITLAHQLNLPLLIEETIGRQVALSAGLQISGIVLVR